VFPQEWRIIPLIYLSAHLLLPVGEELLCGTVIKQRHGKNGGPPTDYNVFQFAMITDIQVHDCNAHALAKEELRLLATGKKHQTTNGWKILVKWKDMLPSVMSVGQVKNSYPVEVAEYAFTNTLDLELAFQCCVREVM
jgi:hypothetical protein